jgi:hypothetical protein
MVIPWALRQATNLEREAEDCPPAAAPAEELVEPAPLEVVELEPQAASTSAVAKTVPASIASRTVRK